MEEIFPRRDASPPSLYVNIFDAVFLFTKNYFPLLPGLTKVFFLQEMSEPNTKRPRLTSSDSALEDEHALILEDLDKCQIEIDKINEAAAEEVLKVEQKYSQIRKPHLQRRKEIIDKIDDFWFSALINHPFLRSIIDELDEECLLYLRNFEVEDREDTQNGYRYVFFSFLMCMFVLPVFCVCPMPVSCVSVCHRNSIFNAICLVNKTIMIWVFDFNIYDKKQ